MLHIVSEYRIGHFDHIVVAYKTEMSIELWPQHVRTI